MANKRHEVYHKANEQDSKVADRVDLLFRGIEIVTASMREKSLRGCR